MKDFRTLTEIAKAARENLSDGDWDYLIGGADTETSLRRNRAAVESWVFKPRVLNNVSQVTTASTLLGTPMRMPVLLPPIGSIQVFSSGGGVDVAAAAAEFGILQILSSACEPEFEAVAQTVPGP
ncbi:MAG TPA: alpha-hydroxy-acid oxidizing enzyme, partial [Gammaproteobacteria bacterium]|nr:alpha-hydroxy-acid oxidizing enzyme [Gammaproteobacteria bacterium]